MIIDKIIAQGCAEEVEDISTQVCDNQETNGLPDDVVLGPRGWVHVWGKEVVIGDAENQVHGSPCTTSVWYLLLTPPQCFRKAVGSFWTNNNLT